MIPPPRQGGGGTKAPAFAFVVARGGVVVRVVVTVAGGFVVKCYLVPAEILRSELCTKWEKLNERTNIEKMRSHQTIQQLTSQLQQMQEQIKFMNDSGDFQDVESN